MPNMTDKVKEIEGKIVKVNRSCEVTLISSGVKYTIPAGVNVMITEVTDNAIIVNINGKIAQIGINDADALIHKTPVIEMDKESSVSKGPVDESKVWEVLKTCYDPEIPINIVDLGLIYECNIVSLEGEGSRIDVKMTLTSPGCEMGQFILDDVYNKLHSVPNVTEVSVELVFDPPWDSNRMSEAARLEAGILW